MKTQTELFTIGAAIQRGEPNPLTEEEKEDLRRVIRSEEKYIDSVVNQKMSRTRGLYDEEQSHVDQLKESIQRAKNQIKFYSFFLEN
jgi:hypothetical protein